MALWKEGAIMDYRFWFGVSLAAACLCAGLTLVSWVH